MPAIHQAARRAFVKAKKANPGAVCLFRMEDVYTALCDDVKIVAGAMGLIVLKDEQMLSLDRARVRQNIDLIKAAGFRTVIIE